MTKLGMCELGLGHGLASCRSALVALRIRAGPGETRKARARLAKRRSAEKPSPLTKHRRVCHRAAEGHSLRRPRYGRTLPWTSYTAPQPSLTHKESRHSLSPSDNVGHPQFMHRSEYIYPDGRAVLRRDMGHTTIVGLHPVPLQRSFLRLRAASLDLLAGHLRARASGSLLSDTMPRSYVRGSPCAQPGAPSSPP